MGQGERPAPVTTISGMPVPARVGPEALRDFDPERDLGEPGRFPFTRGPYPTMYRGRLWTMRQFSGFGTADDTNRRYKFLLENGQTGLSVAFDLPTLYGRDSDHPLSEGEVGKCGVAISSLADMERLFDGIPLAQVSTSMTINSPAAILWAFYLVVAEKQGASWKTLRGTTQNDILKEYIAQKEYIFPPEPSLSLVIDTIEFGTKHVPKWNPVSVSGYHIREAGSTAVQELAFTLGDGFDYVERGVARGMDVDAFAPRLSFFFNSHLDFFEEVAKFRAARRIWARRMRDVHGAQEAESMRLRFHTQTAGCSLTAQQPYNNVVRTATQALAAVLGGTQSLHTNALDETLALPTEEAAKLALRTQQILAFETGVANTIDPLAGSYFVEDATRRMEEGAEEYFDRVAKLGGVVPAIEKGFFQGEIHRAARRYQHEVERGERTIVGVNRFVEERETPLEILRISEKTERDQVRRIRRLRRERHGKGAQRALDRVRKDARAGANMMPAFLEAARAYATLGEILEVLREEHGEYHAPAWH